MPHNKIKDAFLSAVNGYRRSGNSFAVNTAKGLSARQRKSHGHPYFVSCL